MMKNSIRILYLHQFFIPPNASGGTRSYEFARRLIDAGHDVTMVTSSAYLPEQFQGRPERIFCADISDIPATVIDIPYSNEMGFADRIKAFIGFAFHASSIAMKHRADVIFATSTPLTIAIPGMLGRWWQRIPMVFEVRDLWPEIPIAVGAIRNPIIIWATRWLERAAYQSSAHVVALSPGMKEGVTRSGYPSEKVHVLPNSCDVDSFSVSSAEGEAFRNQFDWLAARPLVVYAGTIGKINGVGYLVQLAYEAMKLDPEVRFLIIGRGGNEEECVRQLAMQLGVLDKNFFMIPPLAKNKMPAALSAADLATSTVIDVAELQHNSANKFFDALASGTPIAINHGGWQADLLEKYGAGIVLHPTDVKSAAQAVIEFLRDSTRRQQAASAAFDLAREHFSRDDMAEKLEEILHNAVYES